VSVTLAVFMVFLAISAGCGALVLATSELLGRRKAHRDRARAAQGSPAQLGRLPRPGHESEPRGMRRKFDRWFLRLVRDAGWTSSPAVATFLLLFVGILAGSAALVLTDQPAAALAGVSLGMAVVLACLMIQRARRIATLQQQLPSALDMLARSMCAGQSLDQAVEFVGQRSPEPLAAEFRLCGRQLAMGLSLPAVMRSLVDRVHLIDVRILTTALTVHRQAGGNVAKVIERLAAVIRDRLSYRRQLRAVTGAGRISAAVIGFITPLLFAYLFLFHTHYIQRMFESSLGRSVLLVAIVLEVIGLVWTTRLLRPKY